VSLSTGETLEARIVVSNLDPRATFLDLVGAPNLEAMFANRVRQIRGSGTVGKLHLALAGEPRLTGLDRSLLGNRLVLAPSLKSVEHAFNHSKYGEFSENPVLEITIPSLHESDLAPPGHHVMSVNVAYVPYLETGEDDQYRNELAERTLSGLEHHAPGLRSLIVDQEFLTPRDVESEYGAVQGHWHHGELSMHQSFMMRPVYGSAQYETPIENLFICGAGCHPGGGLTGIPGKNAARRVLEGVRKT
jgi:phytoene dehydrogenase-like protein